MVSGKVVTNHQKSAQELAQTYDQLAGRQLQLNEYTHKQIAVDESKILCQNIAMF